MKETFYFQREVNLDGGKSFAAGEVAGTVEVPEGFGADQLVAAIVSGKAGRNRPAPESPATPEVVVPVAAKVKT